MDDLFLFNATILKNRFDLSQTNIHIKNGIIHSVDFDNIDVINTQNTQIVDCEGKTLLTGFADAHLHLFSYSSSLNQLDVSYPKVKNINQLLNVISNSIENSPEDTWILCDGFDEMDLDNQLSLDILDKISKNNPIKINHRSGHACFMNSLAMKKLSISTSSEDYQRGLIDRDDNGNLTGWFFDMNEQISFLLRDKNQEKRTEINISNTLEQLIHMGIFYIHDASINNDLEKWNICLEHSSSLQFSPSITLLPGIDHLDEFINRGLYFGYKDKDMMLGHTKIIVSSISGSIYPNLNQLSNQISKSHKHGFPVAIHAVTQDEINITLDALEMVYSKNNHPFRDRIEHFTEATPEIITKAKKLGVNLVVNPSFIYQNGFRYSQRIPKMLQPYTFNYRTLLDSGFNLAIGSDAPYGNLDPLINIQSMVNRKDQLGNIYNGNQAISIIESVWLITEGVNNVSTEEIIFEKPSVGDKANIVILNQNLQNIDHTNVHKLAIDVVIKDGFRILS